MTVTDVFKLFFMKQISEDEKENGRRCNVKHSSATFYIDREIFMSIVVKNIDIFETFKEVGTSISNPNRK